MFDKEKKVKFLYDETFARSKVIVNPLRNTASVSISFDDLFLEDIMTAIKNDSKAWENYQSFSEGYKRIRVAYIDAARNSPDGIQKAY